jgi:hypothetical protein
MLHHALAAAEALAAEGVSVEVVDPRTLVPLDGETIVDSVRKTGRLLVVDEAYLTCGIQAEVIALVTERAFGALRTAPRRAESPATCSWWTVASPRADVGAEAEAEGGHRAHVDRADLEGEPVAIGFTAPGEARRRTAARAPSSQA